MKIEQKPAEQLQAQVALYADALDGQRLDQKDGYRASELIHRSIGFIASGTEMPDFVTYPSKKDVKEWHEDRTFSYKRRIGDEIPLFNAKEYNQVLNDPEQRKLVPALGELIASYADFAEEVTQSGMLGLPLDEARKHPYFLSYGGSEQAFKFPHTQPDGTVKYMVLRYGQLANLGGEEQVKNINTGKANTRAITFARGKGIEGLEQGVAVSYDPPVVISEFAAGKQMYDMSSEERANIPQEHWDKLAATVERATEADISLDPNSDNFIYNPASGFTVLDYRTSRHKDPAKNAELNHEGIAKFKDKVLTEENIKKN